MILVPTVCSKYCRMIAPSGRSKDFVSLYHIFAATSKQIAGTELKLDRVLAVQSAGLPDLLCGRDQQDIGRLLSKNLNQQH